VSEIWPGCRIQAKKPGAREDSVVYGCVWRANPSAPLSPAGRRRAILCGRGRRRSRVQPVGEALTAGKAGVDGALVESGALSGSISLQPLRPTRGAIASAHLAAMAIRLTILEQAKRAGVGHIGSALSVADIIAALYAGGLDISDPDPPH